MRQLRLKRMFVVLLIAFVLSTLAFYYWPIITAFFQTQDKVIAGLVAFVAIVVALVPLYSFVFPESSDQAGRKPDTRVKIKVGGDVVQGDKTTYHNHTHNDKSHE